MTVVRMPAMSAGQEQAWHALMDLHDLVPTHWSLVGGQMVHRQRLRKMVTVCATDPTALSVEHAAEHLDRVTRAAGLW